MSAFTYILVADTIGCSWGSQEKVDSKVETNTWEISWRMLLGLNTVKMKAKEQDCAEVKSELWCSEVSLNVSLGHSLFLDLVRSSQLTSNNCLCIHSLS